MQIETLTKKIEEQENNQNEEFQKEKGALTNDNEMLKQDMEKIQGNMKVLTDKSKDNDIFIQALKGNLNYKKYKYTYVGSIHVFFRL